MPSRPAGAGVRPDTGPTLPGGRTDTATFYATTTAVSFTLLGFWWIVIKYRHEELTHDTGRRRLAFVVSLQFVLPGIMSLGALLTGDAPGTFSLQPLQVEGAVMTLLVLIGIMFAWLLFSDPSTHADDVPN
jgi:hypothetical protein